MISDESSGAARGRGPWRRGALLGAVTLSAIVAAAACGDDESISPAGTTTAGTGGAGGGQGGGGPGTGGMGGAGGGQGGAGGGQGGAGGSQPVSVQLLAFNDLHGNLEPPQGSSGRITLHDSTTVDAGGVAFFATHVAALRAQSPNTLVVSAGDLIGASPLVSALFHDEPTIEAMNAIGLDYNSVGNHEFDEGGSELLRMQHGGCHPADGCADGTPFPGAAFTFLAANVVVDASTGKTLFPPYGIREFEGVSVAFIGMTLEGTPDIVTPTGVAGLTFMDEVDTVNALVPELQAQGVEAIVVLLHEGGYQTGFYDECAGASGPILDIATNISDAVDVIVSGHTHQAYNCMIGGKLVTSAASFGRLITDIDLEISRETRDVISKSATQVIVTRDTADPGIGGLVQGYKDLSAPLANAEVGSITADLTNPVPPASPGLTEMGEVIADAQLAATEAPELGGAEIAFMNPGGVRAPLTYAASPPEAADGIVRYGELFTVQPFGNSLVVMTLTGAQIKELLEQQFQTDAGGNPVNRILHVSQGFTYTYSLGAPVGSRIDPASMMLNGVMIDPAQSYRVTVNSFLASGGDKFTILTSGTDRVGGAIDLDALVDYFAASSPLSPPPLDRITALP
ncbi:MAG: bifunctional metallophosphatase/5'-nucleotidase [Polyangiaceae bacterium]|nr:bifunctional metallophosphatase/5'-nucleotidase [Polyangiaceae bacterium]